MANLEHESNFYSTESPFLLVKKDRMNAFSSTLGSPLEDWLKRALYKITFGGFHSVMVEDVGNGQSAQSSNPELGCLHFT